MAEKKKMPPRPKARPSNGKMMVQSAMAKGAKRKGTVPYEADRTSPEYIKPKRPKPRPSSYK